MSTLDPIFYLNVRCSDQPDVRCRLEAGHSLLGRDPAANVQLQHYSVSRRHCRLHVASGQVVLEDIGSTNGTYVNGRLLQSYQPVRLSADKDEVQVGPFRLRLEITTSDHPLASLPPSYGAEECLGLAISVANDLRIVAIEKPALIGSDAACGICVQQAGIASRHAYIQPHGDTLSVEAVGDAALWESGQRVRSAVLRKGEQLRLGERVLLTVRSYYVLRAKAQELGQLDLDLIGKSEFLIGRAPECDVRLEHPLISRRHARLRRRRAGWVVEDLGSVHGTFVDGRRLSSSAVIQEGQTLELAGYKFAIAHSRLKQSPSAGVRRIDALHVGQSLRGGKVILHDVSLHVEAGELVALVGGSGAGKTTLLNALSGFAPASQGSVLFDGRDLYEYYGLFRSQIGYVPQQDILHESLPLARALEYSSKLRLSDHSQAQTHRKWVGSIMTQLGLSRLRRHVIGTLSGGERKRANMAAELITAPSVLFLDEPTSGLDPETEEALMGQLRELADGGKIVVVVTHVTQNLSLCDKIAFIGPGGYLVYFGTPEDALEYFEVKTFSQIYKRLTAEQSPAWWARQYSVSAACARYIGEPQAQVIQRAPSTTSQRRLMAKRASRGQQLVVLVNRYIELVVRDWRNLLMMLLQAPLVAGLMALGFSRTAFSADPAKGDAGDAVTMLFFMAVVAVWFGIFNATREIVKEITVYQRERMASIDVLPYLLSKVIVLAAIGAIQVAAFLAVAALMIELPSGGLEMYIGLYSTLWVGTLIGIGMGLLVSAAVARQDRANTAIIFLLVPQLILAGAFTPVSKMDPVSKVLSLFVAARWTYEALGAQVNILSIAEKMRGSVSETMRATFDVNAASHLAVMAAGLGLLLVLCYVALRRKDPL